MSPIVIPLNTNGEIARTAAAGSVNTMRTRSAVGTASNAGGPEGGIGCYGRIAKARAGKPRPPRTFGHVTTMIAPVAGTRSRLAITSIW
jgi:hypothetical protein